MGQALYRRYRSKSLTELVGQEHITTALERALKNGTISHAYLFTGPRGVGKTSVARILAHEINSLPYEDDATHLDIIEIDAASNRRIDEIRDLRDKVHTAPTSAKYKVYIIDEVHMLTREAFNALLKTLEEPPAHVVFILATTEVHKLPETIISRTQRYSFKPVDQSKVIAHLKHIAQQEKIAIEDDALALIAEHGEGSFRDSISLLDQVRNAGEKITLEMVQRSLGIAPETLLRDLLHAITTHDAPGVVNVLQSLQEQGFEAPSTAKQLGQLLRNELVTAKITLSSETILDLLRALVDVPASRDPRMSLEIALLDLALAQKRLTAHPPTTVPSSEPAPNPAQPPKPEPKVAHENVRVQPATQVEPHPSAFQRARAHTAIKHVASTPLTNEIWQQALNVIKQQHNTLYSILNSVQPVFGDNQLTLECGFAFHKKRLHEARNKQILIDTLRAITGQEPMITLVVVEGTTPSPAEPQLPPADEQVHAVSNDPQKHAGRNDDPIKHISNIFGGAELLE